MEVIVNARNFGQIRSPMHAFLQTRGDAVIGIVADLQDPPELIPKMIAKWEEGYSMVLCTKRTSEENALCSGFAESIRHWYSGYLQSKPFRTSQDSDFTTARSWRPFGRLMIRTRISAV